MRTKVIIVFVIYFFIGCANQPSLRCVSHEFTNKILKNDVEIKNLIEIKGYYKFEINASENVKQEMMFFENGVFAYSLNMAGLYGKYPSYQWGAYKIYNDTIKVQYTSKGSNIVPYNASETWFKILNRTTLRTIYQRQICGNHIADITKYSDAHFVVLDSLPSSDCWLLNEKWFWQNETDWKEYREGLKKKKE